MTIAELHDYCRYLFDENHVHGVPDKWSEGYEFALSLVMFKCHEGLTDEDRKAVAEKVYPTEYWNDGSGCKKVFAANTDDLQEAYIRGREAPPSDVEVEAVAKRLCWDSCEWDGVDSYAAKDEDDAWNYAGEIPGFREGYIRQAKEMLEIARKAVSE